MRILSDSLELFIFFFLLQNYRHRTFNSFDHTVKNVDVGDLKKKKNLGVLREEELKKRQKLLSTYR